MERQINFVVSFMRPMQDKKESFSLRKQELFFIQLLIFFQKDLTNEVQNSFRAFFAETALIIRFDSNFKKEIVCCQLSMQKFKFQYT